MNPHHPSLLNRTRQCGLRRWILPRRQKADVLARFFFGAGGFEMRLQVEPEFGFDAGPVAEAQGRIPGDRSLPVDDLTHAIGRHVDLAREFCGRDAEFRQFVLQNPAGMEGSLEHLHFSSYEW